MANIYVSYRQWQAVAPWVASKAYAVGDIVRQAATPATGAERCFRCIRAGTSGTAEPTWGTGRTSGTNSDGGSSAGVNWVECTGQEAWQGTDGTWRAPHATLHTATNFWADGDTIFVDYRHNYLYAGTFGATLSGKTSQTLPNYIASVDPTVSFPPTGASLRVGAYEQTSAGTLGQSQGITEVWGVTLIAGNGTTSVNLQISGNNITFAAYTKCTLGLGSSGSGATLQLNNGSGTKVRYRDLVVSFGHVNQSILLRGPVDLGNISIAAGSVIPTTGLLGLPNAAAGSITFDAADLSVLGSNPVWGGGAFANAWVVRFIRCKLAPNAVLSINPNGYGAPIFEMIGSDSGTTLNRFERYTFQGVQVIDTTLVRTGGAADLFQAQSYKITTTNVTAIDGYDTSPMAVTLTKAGTYTLTVEGIWDGASLPTQDDVILTASHQVADGNAQGTRVSTAKIGRIAAAATYKGSTSAWDSKVPTRVSGANYAVGAMISLPSKSGQVFICTSAGAAASSLPDAYASAADGMTITDGGAVFRAMVRFKLSVPLTSAAMGVATASLTFSTPNSNLWFDFAPVVA